jgi:predicted membrane chloride channel (bestrophin family)
MSFKNELKSPSVFFFVLGIPLMVIGVYLYARSESPYPNFITGKRQELWGGIIFVSGIVSWIISYVVGNSKTS